MLNRHKVKISVTEYPHPAIFRRNTHKMIGDPDEIVPYCNGMIQELLYEAFRNGSRSKVTISFVFGSAS